MKVIEVPKCLTIDSNDLLHDPRLPRWSAAYQSADPFPHIVIDDFLPEVILDAVVEELASSPFSNEPTFYGIANKRRLSELSRMGGTARRLIEELNSAGFLHFLEAVSGVKSLIADPYLLGGGLQQIGHGGFLKIHADFNWHHRLSLHRRLNVLIYLNRDWREEWGGQLEFWDSAMQQCRRKYAPVFNRMVVFSTTDFSFHGHPEPLSVPAGKLRNSLALYYYSSSRPGAEINVEKSEYSNYQKRPGEKFGSNGHYWFHQFLLKHRLLRAIKARIRKT